MTNTSSIIFLVDDHIAGRCQLVLSEQEGIQLLDMKRNPVDLGSWHWTEIRHVEQRDRLNFKVTITKRTGQKRSFYMQTYGEVKRLLNAIQLFVATQKNKVGLTLRTQLTIVHGRVEGNNNYRPISQQDIVHVTSDYYRGFKNQIEIPLDSAVNSSPPPPPPPPPNYSPSPSSSKSSKDSKKGKKTDKFVDELKSFIKEGRLRPVGRSAPEMCSQSEETNPPENTETTAGMLTTSSDCVLPLTGNSIINEIDSLEKLVIYHADSYSSLPPAIPEEPIPESPTSTSGDSPAQDTSPNANVQFHCSQLRSFPCESHGSDLIVEDDERAQKAQITQTIEPECTPFGHLTNEKCSKESHETV